MKEKLSKVLKIFKTKKAREAEHVSMVRASKYFNESWYLQQNADVRSFGIDAATHYLKYGWKEGRDPGPDFNTAAYMAEHSLIAEEQVCPLVHLAMKSEQNTKPDKSQSTSVVNNKEKAQRQASVIEQSSYFDQEYYCSQYGVKEAAVEHFLKHPKTNPSLEFDSNAYLEAYSDVAKAGINPLVHYELNGKYEGRSAFRVDRAERGEFIIQQLASGNVAGVRVLYVSSTHQAERPIRDASVRYRCYHPAEALMNCGAITHVMSHAQFMSKALPYDYDMYVFHRPAISMEQRINALKAQGKVLIAEYDDLIFGDEDTARTSSVFVNKRMTEDACILTFRQNLEALRLFDYVSVSTELLAEAVRSVHSNAIVHVIHNFIPDSILTVAKDARNRSKDINQIIYCCGSPSHNADFDMIKPALLNCLKKDKNLRLILVGPLAVDDELNSLPNVYFHSLVDYWKLFSIMSTSCLAIAPLQKSHFTNCKSNVKFLEACVSGVHLLASPTSDMKRISDAHITLCETPEDFQHAIESRCNMPYDKMADANYGYLQQNCGSLTFMKEFLALTKKITVK